uniref:D-isomer specific 2-hydroxyacid dehydrogenase catalytic domain-containing protein n=1 Tax=Quercus lobata TaxID=97700 RepID=A0A7N2R5X6_QUELO
MSKYSISSFFLLLLLFAKGGTEKVGNSQSFDTSLRKPSAGLDQVDLVECRHHGIAVTNSGDANSEKVADYAVTLLLDVLRRVFVADRFVRSGLWPQMGEYPLGCKVAGFSVVGLIYGFVLAGVGLGLSRGRGFGFQIRFQVVGFRWAWAVGLGRGRGF